MYYEKQILPIDGDGNFLLAIHFARHKIGGECIRESSHAYFACGNVENPGNLKDITSLFCIERPPNKHAAKDYLNIAKVQEDIGRPETAWQYVYQSNKALQVSMQVPRLVLASRSGLVTVGMDAEIVDLDAGTSELVQRIVNVSDEKTVEEYRSTEIPVANSRIFPKALSDDGETVVSVDFQGYNKVIPAEFSLKKFKRNHLFEKLYPVTEFLFVDNHWIGIDEDRIYKIPIGSDKVVDTFKAPKNVFGWTAAASHDGSLIALCGEKGRLSTVNTNDGTARTYFPHIGASRDDFAVVKLSDSGRWMASKLIRKSKVVLTDLSIGESWVVTTIEDETIVEHQEGKYKSESSIPACFNFIGDRLLVSDTAIREIAMDRPSDVNSIFVSQQGKAGARKPLKLKASDPIDTMIEKAKLTQHKDSLKKFHTPGCLIRSRKPKKSGWSQPDKKGAPELGASRLGGWPDLPDDIAWPTWNDRPMSFLGQINLAEVDRVESEIRVPKSGVLFFFVGCSSDTFQRDPFDSDMYMLELMPSEHDNPDNAVKVIYAKSNSALQRTMYGGDTLPELFPPCSVGLKKGAVPLPHEYTSAYSCLSIDGADVSNYNELLDCLTREDYENQFLGYPQLIQSTPLEWGPENQSLDRDFFFIPNGDVELHEFSIAASKWGLLLQLTSDCNPDFQWGDAGHLYIFGVVEEMERGDFSRCYLNFEN